MSLSSSSTCTILDIPDEILVKIISYLNNRQRLPLANSCPRFKSLVFEDEVLSKDLDFSKEGYLITARDIQQYFGNITTRKSVRKVNIRNVLCMQPGRVLNNSIGKGINLVDVNVHGIKFKDIKQLTSFLELLIHLKRLSVDWPNSKDDDIKMCSRFLQTPLGRLTYFSVKVYVASELFLPNLNHCQELEELRMITKNFLRYGSEMYCTYTSKLNKLSNLKVVQLRGWETTKIKNHVVNMLPEPEEWTDFQLVDSSKEIGFYFEKNVEVCKELREMKLMKGVPYQQENPTYGMGWFLISEYLLREVIKITHEDAPKTFCCLTSTSKPSDEDREPCLLKIDEAKRLLKDPGYQISFLHLKHSIESHCDAHLVASAFPNLTELVLCHKIKTYDTVSTSGTEKHRKRRLRRKGSSMPVEQNDLTNSQSSFEMLIENTPHLRDLTIYAENGRRFESERWDLAALHSIACWKNLTTLRLADIPIKDGNFLINIGKECTELKTLVLHYLRDNSNFDSYASGLMQMLSHCKNLRELSIKESYIDNMSGIFASLSKISKLGRLHLLSTSSMYHYYNLEELISSIEELLRRCQKLTTLVYINNNMYGEDSEKLASVLRRIKDELNHPNLQFQTNQSDFLPNGSRSSNVEAVYKDPSPFFFRSKLDELVT